MNFWHRISQIQYCCGPHEFGKTEFQAFRGESWKKLCPKMSCCNVGLLPSFAFGSHLPFFPHFHLFSTGLKTTLKMFINFVLLFRCASMSSDKNVEEGGGEEKDKRERKSKMFDTVFVPATSNLTTVS